MRTQAQGLRPQAHEHLSAPTSAQNSPKSHLGPESDLESVAEIAWPSRAAQFVRVGATAGLLQGLADPAHATLTPESVAPTAAVGQAKSLEPEDIYIWLDVGNVLVDTRDPAGTKMMPGALQYIADLRAQGYKIGLISNIPAEWGKPGDYASKREALETFLRDTWIGPNPPFDLDQFDEVFLPLYEHEQKPAAKLFNDAMAKTQAAGRVAFYQGEDAPEIDAARRAGMAGFVVRYDVSKAPIYKPVDQIPDYVGADPGINNAPK